MALLPNRRGRAFMVIVTLVSLVLVSLMAVVAINNAREPTIATPFLMAVFVANLFYVYVLFKMCVSYELYLCRWVVAFFMLVLVSINSATIYSTWETRFTTFPTLFAVSAWTYREYQHIPMAILTLLWMAVAVVLTSPTRSKLARHTHPFKQAKRDSDSTSLDSIYEIKALGSHQNVAIDIEMQELGNAVGAENAAITSTDGGSQFASAAVGTGKDATNASSILHDKTAGEDPKHSSSSNLDSSPGKNGSAMVDSQERAHSYIPPVPKKSKRGRGLPVRDED